MNITQQQHDGIVTLNITGRLDAMTAVDAEKEFDEVLQQESDQLLVNLAGLDYISSAGLRVLLVVAKKVQQRGGKVVLAELTPGVKEVFEISGFSSIFKIFDSSEEAVAFLKG